MTNRTEKEHLQEGTQPVSTRRADMESSSRWPHLNDIIALHQTDHRVAARELYQITANVADFLDLVRELNLKGYPVSFH